MDMDAPNVGLVCYLFKQEAGLMRLMLTKKLALPQEKIHLP